LRCKSMVNSMISDLAGKRLRRVDAVTSASEDDL